MINITPGTEASGGGGQDSSMHSSMDDDLCGIYTWMVSHIANFFEVPFIRQLSLYSELTDSDSNVLIIRRTTYSKIGHLGKCLQ